MKHALLTSEMTVFSASSHHPMEEGQDMLSGRRASVNLATAKDARNGAPCGILSALMASTM